MLVVKGQLLGVKEGSYKNKSGETVRTARATVIDGDSMYPTLVETWGNRCDELLELASKKGNEVAIAVYPKVYNGKIRYNYQSLVGSK